MSTGMQEAVAVHLRSRSAATARDLQRAISRSDGFEQDTVWFDRAVALAEQSRHDELDRLIRGRMPGVFGCPVAHRLWAEALTGLGDAEGARRERAYAALALEVIAATGDGTEAKPWWVLHVVDEYAFLDAHGHEAETQRLILSGPALVDGIDCRDGVTRHFALEASDDDA